MKKASRALAPLIFLFSAISILFFSGLVLAAQKTSEEPLPNLRGLEGKPSPAVATYDELLKAIRAARSESQSQIEAAVEQEKVREAWEIGKLIDEHVLQHKERADYGKQVILRLARDLSTSETELKYMHQFARSYPIRPPADELSWAHYRELLSVNNTKARKALEEKASREKWPRDRVREEVRKIKQTESVGNGHVRSLPLNAEPGKIGTYRVIRAKAGPLAGELVLDLGFAIYHKPESFEDFKEGDIVTLPAPPPSFVRKEGNAEGKNQEMPSAPGGEKSNSGAEANHHWPLQHLDGSTESDLYTYQAYVYDVLDGDTANAVVDLGFDTFTQQTLRLRGIDAPELPSTSGREAKEALEKMLGQGRVLIRTTKSDKYDRYLVDLWSKEIYVNQKLVDDGHAVKVEE